MGSDNRNEYEGRDLRAGGQLRAWNNRPGGRYGQKIMKRRLQGHITWKNTEQGGRTGMIFDLSLNERDSIELR